MDPLPQSVEEKRSTNLVPAHQFDSRLGVKSGDGRLCGVGLLVRLLSGGGKGKRKSVVEVCESPPSQRGMLFREYNYRRGVRGLVSKLRFPVTVALRKNKGEISISFRKSEEKRSSGLAPNCNRRLKKETA